MTRYDPDKHHRRSIRLPEWDYRRAGAYFVTLVTYDRGTLFGQVVNGEMVLSPFGRVAATIWQRLPSHFPHVRLDEFVVMPNHLHGVVWLTNDGEGRGEASSAETRQSEGSASGEEEGQHVAILGMPHPYMESGSLGAIVGNFKSATTRRINRMRHTPNALVWQRNYYERIIRNERELDAIRRHILDNPNRWDEDSENPHLVRVGARHPQQGPGTPKADGMAEEPRNA
mgnify:CR=1 FL=1